MLCNVGNETTNHLFVECRFAAAIWTALMQLFGCPFTTNGSIRDLIDSAFNQRFSSQIAAIWCNGIVSVVWLIWYTRNTLHF